MKLRRKFLCRTPFESSEDSAFARFVLAMGNAEVPGEPIDVDTARITLPRAVQVVDSPEDLATWVAEGVRQPRDLLHHAIICPTNDAVLHANELVHAMQVQREEQEEEGEAERGDRGLPRRRLEEHAADGDSHLLRSYVSSPTTRTRRTWSPKSSCTRPRRRACHLTSSSSRKTRCS